MAEKLFEHVTHHHKPKNVNEVHQAEQEAGGFNQRLAVAITKGTGTMFCAYLFACLALLGFPAFSALLIPGIAIYVIWISQTFIQLCMLPILAVGQAVLGRRQELQAEEMYKTTQHSFHDIEQIVAHLNAQDSALLDVQRHMDRQRELLSKQTTVLLHTQSEVKEILAQIHLAPLVDARPALACIDAIRENLIPIHNFLNASSLTTEHQKRMMAVWDAVSRLALILGSTREEETLE